MQKRQRLALAAAVGIAAAGVAVTPAFAGDTAATFTLSGNPSGLTVSVPDGSVTPISLGSGNAGDASLAGQLGNVTVTDTRGALTASWTATVSSTNFTTGTATAQETVAKANISYSSGVSTNLLSGQVGAFTPSVGVTLGSAKTAGSWLGVGNNTVKWNPTLTFTLQTAQVAGTYSGTVTHSVA
jgi:hypothetical protein